MTSNIFDINYHQTGKSKSTNSLGMRKMQERVLKTQVEALISKSSSSIWKKPSF